MKVRLDQLLVTRGLAESRSRAKAAIAAGGVTIDGAPARAASQPVDDAAVLTHAAAHGWVGRGALKLDHALTLWPVAVEGRVVLDIGASTGGFTEVCLTRGVARVFAVDVGSGQMHGRVAADPRVVNLEQTDARDLTPALIPEAPALIVCDASFIGLAKVLPAALALAERGADLITLVKPQFEAAGPGGTKKGVVKDPAAQQAALTAVSTWLEGQGWPVQATAESPITGGDGNVEFLLWAKRGGVRGREPLHRLAVPLPIAVRQGGDSLSSDKKLRAQAASDRVASVSAQTAENRRWITPPAAPVTSPIDRGAEN